MERLVEHAARVEGHQARVGRCPRCAAFTYDVAGLSDEDVRRLVLETEGRVLTRLVARRDGRVMSVDCGHGTVAPSSPRWRVGLAVVLVGGLLGVAASRSLASRLGGQDAEVITLPQPEVAMPALVVPEPVPTAPAADTPREDEAPAPSVRMAEVHLADLRTTWPSRVAVVADVADALRSQLGPARECYQRRLETAPDFRASIQLTMTVGGGVVEDVRLSEGTTQFPSLGGRVKGARATTVVDHGVRHPEYLALRDCVRDAMRTVTFTPRDRATLWFRLVFDGW
ncbi:MAG: hypothetical protein SFW67_30665 [Myxococcaceae bacterium]|nr:hypothetical protein [Myxococcaceae bacterium]